MTTANSQILNFKAKKNNLILAAKYPYQLCRIADSRGDLSKTWYVEFRIWDETLGKLKRKRVVLNHPTAAERYKFAKAKVKEIDELLKIGVAINRIPQAIPQASDAIKQTTPVIDAVIYFLKFNKKILKSNSYESYVTDFNRFEKYLKANNLEKITLAQFDELSAITCLDQLTIAQNLGNRTRNNVKATLGTLFNFFKTRKIINTNPFSKIKKLPSQAKKHTAISNIHAKQIIKACEEQNEPQLLLFIYFIYFVSVRPNFELRLLKIKDILDKTIFITSENAKDNTSEHVMIPAAFEEVLQKYKIRDYPKDYYVFSKNNEPGPTHNGKKYQYVRHREILKNLKIDHLKYDIYSWKHTGVIALYLATQNIELIRQQCRHKNITTTTKYLRDLGLFVDYDQINKFPSP